MPDLEQCGAPDSDLQESHLYDLPQDNPLYHDKTGLTSMWADRVSANQWMDQEGVELYTHPRIEASDAKMSSSDIVGLPRSLEFVDYVVRNCDFDPNGACVLDVGSGDGNFSILLASLGAKQVDALDPSRAQLDRAALTLAQTEMLKRFGHALKERIGDLPCAIDPHRARDAVRLLEGYGENLNAQGSYDAAFAKFSHHWADASLMFANIARALKPGGRLFVMTTLPAEEHTVHGIKRPNLFCSAWNDMVDDKRVQGYQFEIKRPTNANIIAYGPQMEAFLKKLGLTQISEKAYDEPTHSSPEGYITFLDGVIRPNIEHYLRLKSGVSQPGRPLGIHDVRDEIRGRMEDLAVNEGRSRTTIERIGMFEFQKLGL